jgi:PAS domain S-box-containing protein
MSSPQHAQSVVHNEQLQPFYDKINAKADRINTGFIVGFFILGIGLSFFHQTYVVAFLMGGISLTIYLLTRTLAPGSQALRLVTSFLYWNFGVQFLFQMHGLYEMKFMFFIALTVLLFYEDWKVFIPATTYALTTLFLLYYFKESEFIKSYFSQSQEVSLTSFLIHFISIGFYAGLCMWWAMLQREQTKESGIAAIRMEEQLHMVDVNINFADNISRGNLTSVYGSDRPDKLGESLLNMRVSLQQSSVREDREKFSALGLARIGDILRQNADNLDTLCDKVTEEVVKYMKANQGFMFVKEGSENNEHLVMMAGRAWERKKYLQKTIEIGDGLIGQAAIERRSILLTSIPQNYVRITSGLGEATPRCILIIPLKTEDELVGIIELASFQVYQEFEIKFMEKVGESIAATILTTRNNQRNKELLEKSNELAEQMRSQEEEIRQNMEEMQATQEEMQRKNREIERLLDVSGEKEKELVRKLEEIEKLRIESDLRNEQMLQETQNYKKTLLNILDQLPHKIFLKDAEGKMVLVNTAVANAHDMTIDELIGKSDFDFVDSETAQQWRNQELEIMRKGSETYIFDESLMGETKTLKSTKSAFFIPHLNQTGLLGIQTDITELERLRKSISEPVS